MALDSICMRTVGKSSSRLKFWYIHIVKICYFVCTNLFWNLRLALDYSLLCILKINENVVVTILSKEKALISRVRKRHFYISRGKKNEPKPCRTHLMLLLWHPQWKQKILKHWITIRKPCILISPNYFSFVSSITMWTL